MRTSPPSLALYNRTVTASLIVVDQSYWAMLRTSCWSLGTVLWVVMSLKLSLRLSRFVKNPQNNRNNWRLIGYLEVWTYRRGWLFSVSHVPAEWMCSVSHLSFLVQVICKLSPLARSHLVNDRLKVTSICQFAWNACTDKVFYYFHAQCQPNKLLYGVLLISYDCTNVQV